MKKFIIGLFSLIGTYIHAQIFVPPPPPENMSRKVDVNLIPNKKEFYDKFTVSPHFKGDEKQPYGHPALPEIVFKNVVESSCNDELVHDVDDRTHVLVYISRKGKVIKVEVPDQSIEEKCRQGIIKTILPLKFAPGKINGKVVNSIYDEIVYIRKSPYTEFLIDKK